MRVSPQAVNDSGDVAARLSRFGDESGHRTLAEKAFGMLHDAIVMGALRPGERLPIEELAAVMELSPMPIREALRRLDAVGLVENIPHRGARVADLTLADLKEVYDARLLLEIPAISGAAENFTAEEEESALQHLARFEKATAAGERTDALRAHTAFHFELYRAASSRWLPRLISPLWDNAERYRAAASGGALGLFGGRAQEHRRMLQACVDHDSQLAGDLLWNHLALTANGVAAEMGGDQLYPLREAPTADAA
jgi:DNA-binding GntR family transcriptional regulator